MKPIIFNTDMVRAILDGRKTETRRVVKPQPRGRLFPELPGGCWPKYFVEEGTPRVVRPPYRPSDILYVRETWSHTCIHCKHYPDMLFCPSDCGVCPEFVYKADGVTLDGWPYKRWKASIHMPREAARIFLRVSNVRLERLKDITPEQAIKEGTVSKENRPYIQYEQVGQLEVYARNRMFPILWNLTIKPEEINLYGWDANPFVWVIEFERCEKPKDG